MRRTRPLTMPGAERRTTALEPLDRLLRTGDRLTRQQFHALYELTPKHFRADLIDGVVYVSSPLKNPHGRWHTRIMSILIDYQLATPGVEAFINTSLIVNDVNECQPDATLCLAAECKGGAGETPDGYMTGSPELLVEVADSSKRLDLGAKRIAHTQAGTLEYVVINLSDQKVRLFDLRTDQPIDADARGVFQSRVFPGLWIDALTFFQPASTMFRKVLKRGLRSAEHSRFVKLLAARRKRRGRSR